MHEPTPNSIRATEGRRSPGGARRTASWWLLAAVCAVLPALTVTVLLQVWLGASPQDFTPVEWNDQIGYWHYIGSFSEVGFGSGYYTPNENPAPVGFIHFDAHGPAFPVIYGLPAFFTGWGFSTSVFFNMALSSACILVFLWGAKLDGKQLVGTGLVSVLTWQILFYIPTAMQETLHHAIAFLLAALFVLVIRAGGRLTAGPKILFVLVLECAAIARLSWALLLVPLFVLTRRRKDIVGVVQAAAASALSVGIAMLLLRSVTPAGGSSIFGSLRMLANSPQKGLREILAVTWANIEELAALSRAGDLGSAVLQQTLLLMVVCLACVLMQRTVYGRTSASVATKITMSSAENHFHAYNLSIIVATALLFYIPNGYERVFFPPLLTSLLVLLAFRRYLLVGAMLLVSLAHAPDFREAYDLLRPLYAADRVSIEERSAEMARVLVYDPEATNPWCNTVLIPAEIYDDRVLTIPAGIGVSYAIAPGIVGDDRRLVAPFRDRSIRSRYLIDTESFALVERLPAFPAEFVGMTPAGRLYYNPLSGCDPPAWNPGAAGVRPSVSSRPAPTKPGAETGPE